MPTREEVMDHICQLFTAGSGEPISSDVRTELESRYLGWIETKKPAAPAKPIEVWEQKDGKDLQKKFEQIGERAAKKAKDKKKAKIEKDDCVEASVEVESESDCPYCP
jgi:hypothetical protein